MCASGVDCVRVSESHFNIFCMLPLDAKCFDEGRKRRGEYSEEASHTVGYLPDAQ